MFEIQDTFNLINLPIYLSYGTLLGAVREHDFIKGDLDIDLYVKDEKLLFSNLKFIEENGIRLIRAIPHSTYSFRVENYNQCYVDVYVCHTPFSLWSIYCYQLYNYMTPKKYLKDGSIEFLGREFCCPYKPEKILKFWYGNTWNVPIGKFEKKYKYEVSSHYYYLIIKRKIKDFLMCVLGLKLYNLIKSILGK